MFKLFGLTQKSSGKVVRVADVTDSDFVVTTWQAKFLKTNAFSLIVKYPCAKMVSIHQLNFFYFFLGGIYPEIPKPSAEIPDFQVKPNPTNAE